ncbi:uncharacterized protein CDV56_102157 [Aspergillus thermomutatus]|uniref:Uncharacterized protein n=1 Tax=Aspergillus thermomutatus TaxID=41047 RepID=A0A397GMD5_ASPTH|nr:uncharacterized protein CDV56_102157 [Aspergillus thermomutatus]RHZ50193.1 hypothetical protein CDV56_102157 [Aspergillus thermomutatus]
MAGTYSFLPGDLNASLKSRNRPYTGVRLPSSSPAKKRASSFYPDHGPEIVDETNPDPFYLEHSLGRSGAWGRSRRDIRDVRFCEESKQYFMLSSANHSQKEPTFPRSVRGESKRAHRPGHPDRPTLSVVEFEHQYSLPPQVAVPRWEKYPLHQSQGSFSSVQTDATPDLTPSSSFSSNYSSAFYPDSGLQGSDYPALPAQLPNQSTYSKSLEKFHQASSTPSGGLRPASSKSPSTPARNTEFASSTETLRMPRTDDQDLSSRRGKPLPSLPINPRHGSGVSSKRGTNSSGRRPSIEPSMISPPCLINPVTLEPHTTHFDQAMFIPANECPSPVPSRGPPSPTTTNEAPVSSKRERPSTSASEAPFEHSVWEPDSDSESLGPKSLSKKPMDTLKKVRSRVQLRVAKSAPKLQSSTPSPPTDPPLEKFPTMPDHPPRNPFPEPVKSMAPLTLSSRDVFRPSPLQTLRLVSPSTTSLVRTRTPRSRRNSSQTRAQNRDQPRNYDFDRSAAAAIQAKSRRKQRSDSLATWRVTDREKVCTFCREERSDVAIHHSLTLARPPLYKRVWESLRLLGCHGDITPPKSLPRKSV